MIAQVGFETPSARIVLDTAHPDRPDQARLTSLEVRIPTLYLPHLLTHRRFSRNTSSQRAIGIKKQIAAILASPYVPTEVRGKARGMAGGAPLTGSALVAFQDGWIEDMHNAIERARVYDAMDIHQETASRILLPYSWSTVLVSATEWGNFFAQRITGAAQPDTRALAVAVCDALAASTPIPRRFHLPYHNPDVDGFTDLFHPGTFGMIVTAARCARVSYGRPGAHAQDRALGDRLVADAHPSPFEHVASAADPWRNYANFRGFVQFRERVETWNEWGANQRGGSANGEAT